MNEIVNIEQPNIAVYIPEVTENLLGGSNFISIGKDRKGDLVDDASFCVDTLIDGHIKRTYDIGLGNIIRITNVNPRDNRTFLGILSPSAWTGLSPNASRVGSCRTREKVHTSQRARPRFISGVPNVSKVKKEGCWISVSVLEERVDPMLLYKN